MDYLPVFFRIEQQPCLVVGGGHIAKRKVSLLLKAKAKVTVIALDVLPELQDVVLKSGGEVIIAGYHASYLNGKRLVIAATDDDILNRQVFADSEVLNIPVNVVDSPELCRFIFPSIIDRSPVVIAISSSGQSPVLARMLRTRLESMIPAAYGQLAEFVGKFRKQIQATLPDTSVRRAFWEKELQGRFAELVYNGRLDEAETHLQHALIANQPPSGEVYLVGAGPGDPDLLTFRALRLMQQADVVVYDRLVSQPILDLCRRDADMVYVGKARADHAVPQEDINHLLVRLAKEGKRVCRLKGGDPFIFGRGGEEIEELAEAGIPFQVVPGITAASGCSAYAGIPLTHRDYAQSVRFVTGHLKDGTPNLPWSELIHERQTLVLYMGLVGLAEICQQLIAHGMRPDMPVALVSHGTTPKQKVLIGEIQNIAEKVANSGIKAPTLTIIGDVVKLQDKLAWFGG
ncbi:uroporphyrinogen-III C-methyltransferase [Moraxellaceae bacterium AER2_44_116]|nr:uroporphyrinogen-III C-methyltransferase [Moraxellaceae bacterium]TQC99943.1 uroporphyrinogen-III C-methyltransferase [Moraxellaceae bacterium AER2_44_116]